MSGERHPHFCPDQRPLSMRKPFKPILSIVLDLGCRLAGRELQLATMNQRLWVLWNSCNS
jgi:hypothetical protein